MPCAEVASSSLSWTTEADVLGIRMLLQMADVRCHNGESDMALQKERKGPTFVSNDGPSNVQIGHRKKNSSVLKE